MKLYKSLKNISAITNSVVSIGMFDGVHLGHASVINRVIQIAKDKRINSIIITFSNSPSSYFSKDNTDLLITNSKEKIELFRKTELDYLFIIEFNDIIASLNTSTFIKEILIALFKVNYIVFGYDNHFGKNREGTFDYINANFKDIKAELIIASKKNEMAISSTRVKEEILKGHIINVNNLLGHRFTINGKVIKGMQLGRKLGFPTANITYNRDEKIIPRKGVYHTIIKIRGEEYLSITNIGIKPSVQNSNTISIETHILDYNNSIYGLNVSLIFMDRIRDEIKFNQLNDLIEQITKDIEVVRKLNSLQITT